MFRTRSVTPSTALSLLASCFVLAACGDDVPVGPSGLRIAFADEVVELGAGRAGQVQIRSGEPDPVGPITFRVEEKRGPTPEAGELIRVSLIPGSIAVIRKGERLSVALSVRTPAAAPLGSYSVTLAALVDGQVADTIEVRFRVTEGSPIGAA
ncbi:MAG: hypothetical protein D6701_09160 [Gemmatimonadetes bacterium]|nr:MAG: hypothetical protein D6701_09160 [Gemmatimonadota bacterium]